MTQNQSRIFVFPVQLLIIKKTKFDIFIYYKWQDIRYVIRRFIGKFLRYLDNFYRQFRLSLWLKATESVQRDLNVLMQWSPSRIGQPVIFYI